jgi:hypothetical protein
MGDGDDRSVSEHYGRGDLATTILEALRTAGKETHALTTEDLAPVPGRLALRPR